MQVREWMSKDQVDLIRQLVQIQDMEEIKVNVIYNVHINYASAMIKRDNIF